MEQKFQVQKDKQQSLLKAVAITAIVFIMTLSLSTQSALATTNETVGALPQEFTDFGDFEHAVINGQDYFASNLGSSTGSDDLKAITICTPNTQSELMDCENIADNFSGSSFQGPEFVQTPATQEYPDGRWGLLYQGLQGIHAIFLGEDGWKYDVNGDLLPNKSGTPLPSMITLIESGFDLTAGMVPGFQRLGSNMFNSFSFTGEEFFFGYLSSKYATDIVSTMTNLGYSTENRIMTQHPSEEGTVILTANDGIGWALFQVTIDDNGGIIGTPKRLTAYISFIQKITSLAAEIHPATGDLVVYAAFKKYKMIAVWQGKADGSDLSLTNVFKNLSFKPDHLRTEVDTDNNIVYLHMIERMGLNRGSYIIVHTPTTVESPVFLDSHGAGAEAAVENGKLVLFYKEGSLMKKAFDFDALN